MRFPLAIALLFGLLSVTACNAKPKQLGDGCENDHQCGADGACRSGTCRPLGIAGESCSYTSTEDIQCRSPLVCDPGDIPCGTVRCNGTCRTKEWVAKNEAAKAEAAKLEMLKQSGIGEERLREEMEVVETPASSEVGAGLPVRVVRTEAKGRGLAACRRDERLIGGSCAGAGKSSPEDFSASDTVGAKWICEAGPNAQTITYALCQKLPVTAKPQPKKR